MKGQDSSPWVCSLHPRSPDTISSSFPSVPDHLATFFLDILHHLNCGMEADPPLPLILFYPFLITLSLSGSWGGSWRLSQLHMGAHCRAPVWAFGGSEPWLKGTLTVFWTLLPEPLQRLVHTGAWTRNPLFPSLPYRPINTFNNTC